VNKISTVVTFTPGYDSINNLEKCISSAYGFTDDVVVVVNGKSEEIGKFAKKFNAALYSHEFVNYVERLRNFGIQKAKFDWVLILDPDEEFQSSLAKKLKGVVKSDSVDYVLIPRKNIIFGKWMKHSRWWPDYNVRFFKKGKVSWSDEIHAPPVTLGRGMEIPINQDLAIVHDHYGSIEEYLERMGRYTSIQASTLKSEDYKFKWQDLLAKPTSEFLSRYFAGFGYKDGLHGLVVASLQATSEFVLYLKLWQGSKFKEADIMPDDLFKIVKKQRKEFDWWVINSFLKSASAPKKLLLKIYRKLFLR